MSPEEGPRVAIDGRPIDEAVEAVVDAGGSRDPDRVRAALDYVTEGGVVRDAAVEPAFGHLSKVVSTPETRVELAEIALEDARETAEPVAHLDTVAARLEAFEQRVQRVADRAAGLGDELSAVIDRHDGPLDLYPTAVGIRRLTERANALRAAADDVQRDLGGFENWVETESARLDDLEEDVAAAEGEFDDLVGAVDTLASGAVYDPAVHWVRSVVGCRVTELLVADLRAEAADLRNWPGGVDDESRLAGVEADIDALDDRLDDLDDRLDDLAEPAWRDRYDDGVAAFEAALDEVSPPVDWGALQQLVEERHPVGRGGD